MTLDVDDVVVRRRIGKVEVVVFGFMMGVRCGGGWHHAPLFLFELAYYLSYYHDNFDMRRGD